MRDLVECTCRLEQRSHHISLLTDPEDVVEANLVFTAQPLPVYYVTSKHSVTLRCSAKDARDIHIKCYKDYIRDTSITKSQTVVNGQRIFTVSINNYTNLFVIENIVL